MFKKGTTPLNQKGNFLSNIDTRLKLITVFILLFANVGFSDISFSLLMLINAISITIITELKLLRILKDLKVPVLFSVFILIMQAMWFKQGREIEILGIKLYEYGILRGIKTLFTVVSGVWLLLLVSYTSKPDEFLSAFKKLGIPPVIIDVIIMMYRYMFVLKEETMRIFYAQKVRLGYSNFKNSIKSISELWGIVLINSLLRSSRVYEAMMARGYNGKLFYEKKDEIKVKELVSVSGYIIVTIGIGVALKLLLH
ncbi:MAG: cobalt ECF transporter T component CbiQ [Brevinematales bacterium]|nr:cobalt ECF transporter T component CbiQ [Brevinematales bacterium]